LDSDNIIKFYDILKTHNHFYLIVEYCDGGDLNKYIEKKKGLKEEEALRFFYQIVRGFRSIVKAKLIHRDLKPANIMIKQHQIKIGDFGLAKVLSQDLGKSFAGSPFNMAPEILEHK
jgi:serine/threonine-protein kinase ULK/ATG1